ncbi:MAG: butyrate kinase, partial [Firmicutes bacterium]|nr:butyrate kinase [Bacillota bacterium]
MSARAQLLIVNPGSTSTRVALFQETELITSITITHPTSEIQQLTGIDAQYQYRLRQIEAFLKQTGMPLLAAVVGRGGLLSPVPSGTYLVDDKMLYDLQQGVYGQHASNLGGILARGLADPRQIPAYVVDPVSVDEFVPEARLSGLPQVARRSLGHALNMRAVAQYLASKQGRLLAEVNYIVAHLGGGISIAPIAGGRILDCNDANQAGPFSAERAGSLPAGEIIRLSYSGKYTLAQ